MCIYDKRFFSLRAHAFAREEENSFSHCADASYSEIFINVRKHDPLSLFDLPFSLWGIKRNKIKIFVTKYTRNFIKIEEESCGVSFSHFQKIDNTTKII